MDNPPDHLDQEQRLRVMKQEIDALQIAITGHSKPWYQNISTLLSIIAMLFSFGTTFVSYRRAASQDIQSARQELRGLLLRLTALPKESVDAAKKYVDDVGSRNLIGAYINQENTLLAKNAAEIAKKLPKHAISATEFYAIAGALQSAYDLVGASDFLDRAINASPDFNTEISTLRMIANMKFIQGRPETGRVEYQRALDIFSRYPEFDPFTRADTNVRTELAWAMSEASINALGLANQHLQSAEEIVAPLPRSPGVDMLKSMIQQARFAYNNGGPVPSSLPGSPVGQVEVDPNRWTADRGD